MTSRDFSHGKTQSVEYPEQPNGSFSYTSIDVLPFLKGRPWDDVSLAYVSGLRPSYIRVVHGAMHCDARVWRVTVYLDDKDLITDISQEVMVWLPEGVRHGSALSAALAMASIRLSASGTRIVAW